LWFPPSVRAQVRKFRPDIIHIATPDVVGKGALRFAHKYNIPVVASYHTHFTSYMKYYGLELVVNSMWNMFRKFYSQCQHIYVPSESMAEILRENGITKGLKIWERGIEMDIFSPSKRSLEWRRSLDIADDELVISFVSRLVWEKGLDVFMDVIKRLEREGIKHKSLIVGEGAAEDSLRQQLPNTIFTGKLYREDLSRAYASSDIFLFPSDTETFGNVTLEAMASGLPCICADATGSRELVKDGETGFLVETKNREAFYQATKTLLEDTLLRKQMGQKGLERSKLYDWNTILAKIDGYYDLALAEFAASKIKTL
jgi:glycosyltransferase involved in cell wall biosynthesis